MAKNNTLLIGGLLLAGFFIYKNSQAGGGKRKRGSVLVDDVQTVVPGSEEWAKTPDAVIDTEKQKLSIPDAVAMAKDVIGQVKDALVVVKTKKKTLALRTGRKRLTNTKGRRIRNFKYKGKKLSMRKAKNIFSAKNTSRFTFGL